MRMKTRISQLSAAVIFFITTSAVMGCYPNAGSVAEPVQHDQNAAKSKQQMQKPQTAQSPDQVQLTEQDAIAKALKERNETSFPTTPSKTSGLIHVAIPGSTRDIHAQVQTQVMKQADNDDVVTLTEWWSSKDFPKMAIGADGKLNTIKTDHAETLSHTWKYEVTPDATKLVADDGDYPPDYIN